VRVLEELYEALYGGAESIETQTPPATQTQDEIQDPSQSFVSNSNQPLQTVIPHLNQQPQNIELNSNQHLLNSFVNDAQIWDDSCREIKTRHDDEFIDTDSTNRFSKKQKIDYSDVPETTIQSLQPSFDNINTFIFPNDNRPTVSSIQSPPPSSISSPSHPHPHHPLSLPLPVTAPLPPKPSSAFSDKPTDPPLRPTPCKFFMANPLSCTKGSVCAFSHDPADRPLINNTTSNSADGPGVSETDPSATVCVYFQRGEGGCKRGERCLYSHDLDGVGGEENRLLKQQKHQPQKKKEMKDGSGVAVKGVKIFSKEDGARVAVKDLLVNAGGVCMEVNDGEGVVEAGNEMKCKMRVDSDWVSSTCSEEQDWSSLLNFL
jgi:hypothetical protein